MIITILGLVVYGLIAGFVGYIFGQDKQKKADDEKISAKNMIISQLKNKLEE